MQNDTSMQEILTRIKMRRLELNYSFQDLADATGMSKSTLQRYETGGIKNLPIDKLKLLASSLGVSPEWIMGWEQKKPTQEGGLTAKDMQLLKDLQELTAEQLALVQERIAVYQELNEKQEK